MSTRRRVLGGLLASGAAVLLWANMGRSAQQTASTHDATDYCVHDAQSSIEPVASYDDVPELHDCQRFLERDGKELKYIDIFRILAVPPRLTADAIDSVLKQRRLAAASAPRGAPSAPPLVEVAIIEAQGDYTPLGISKGANCLYLYEEVQPKKWGAVILPVPTGQKTCPTSGNGTAPLEVRPMAYDEFKSEDDYPAVARWDWDATNLQQYIGIKCGPAWCEIGAPGFSASEPIPMLPSLADDERRVRLIKGWHDRQLLAYNDPKHGLRPSRVTGILIPHPKLGTYDMSAFKGKDRAPVASVLLVALLPEDKPILKVYEKKYHIDVPGDDGLMQMGIKLNTDTTGKATIRNPSNVLNKEKSRDIKRHVFSEEFKRTAFHRSGKTPGAVRWRWMEKDEGTWIRCSEGCCEMTG